ncbi:MAG: hypothetical protein QM762_22935 [Chryseolinea sp.]
MDLVITPISETKIRQVNFFMLDQYELKVLNTALNFKWPHKQWVQQDLIVFGSCLARDYVTTTDEP